MSDCKSGAQHDSAWPDISQSSWCSAQHMISDIVIGPLAQADSAITIMLTASQEPMARRIKPGSILLSLVRNRRPVNCLDEGPATLVDLVGGEVFPFDFRGVFDWTGYDAEAARRHPYGLIGPQHMDSRLGRRRSRRLAGWGPLRVDGLDSSAWGISDGDDGRVSGVMRPPTLPQAPRQQFSRAGPPGDPMTSRSGIPFLRS